jgi:hypothetical protein
LSARLTDAGGRGSTAAGLGRSECEYKKRGGDAAFFYERYQQREMT